MNSQPLRIGIGGPVGSGKTALTLALCLALRERYNLAVVTNDIYTQEDAQFLVRNEALAPERIIGVETGGCPHTAIREDASINLEAVDQLNRRFPGLDLIIVESGGDNLSATFSPELSDLTIYVIDVSAGDKLPRKGGPGICKSDLLVINKIDLALLVGASLEVMERDTLKMRGDKPFVFSNQKIGKGLDEIIAFIERHACSRQPENLIQSRRYPHEPAQNLIRSCPVPQPRRGLRPCRTRPRWHPGGSGAPAIRPRSLARDARRRPVGRAAIRRGALGVAADLRRQHAGRWPARL